MALLNRRSALVGAVSSLFIPPGLASTLVEKVPAADIMSAEQRRAFHLAEYQRVSEELDPMIVSWSESDQGGRLTLTAIRISGRYVGDGFYECWAPFRANKVVHLVRLLPDRIDGHQTFSLTPWPGISRPLCTVTEPVLEQTVCHFMGAA